MSKTAPAPAPAPDTSSETADATPLVDRQQLLGSTLRRFAVYKIPHLGAVRVRSLTERERSIYETETLNDEGDGADRDRLEDARRRLICACVVDAEGNTLLKPGDVNALADIDGAISGALFDVCREHCGFQKGDVDRLAERLGGNGDGGSN